MKQLSNYILVTLASMLMVSCVSDLGDDIVPRQNREVKVEFGINLPPTDSPVAGTRALDSPDENFIKTIDVYPFVSSPDGKFIYNGKVARVTDPQNPVTKFQASLLAYPDNDQKLLIIVNARDEADFNIKLHEDIETAKKKLIISRANEWNTTSTNDFDPIPMYAETTAQAIRENTTTVGPFTLVRMLARFDVRVRAFDPGTDPALDDPKIVLNSVQIFNRKNTGAIWYVTKENDPSNWNGAEERTVKPNIPAGDYDDITEYRPVTVFTATGGESRRQLYAFEAPANTDKLKKTALVIGGWYDGAEQIPANERFYRIDVPDEITDGHILRNCWYDIEVQSAKGPGADTAEDAFKGTAVIQANIDVWTPANQNLISDGQYRLWVEKSTVQMDGKPDTQTFQAITTHPDGIKFDESGMDSWLAVSAVQDNQDETKWSIELTAELNTRPETRTTTFYIIAGNMRCKMTAVQDVTPIGIRIYDENDNEISELFFSGIVNVVPDAQKIRMEWYPENATVKVPRVTTPYYGNQNFIFSGSGDSFTMNMEISDPSGSKEFTIIPHFASNTAKKDMEIRFTLSQSGSNFEKRFMITQFLPVLQFEPEYWIAIPTSNVTATSLPIMTNMDLDVEFSALTGPLLIDKDRAYTKKVIWRKDSGNSYNISYNTAPASEQTRPDYDDHTTLIYLRNETYGIDATITLHAVGAGRNGVFKPYRIGENMYDTHEFLDPTTQKRYAWMVENAREELTGAVKTYPGKEAEASRGYYSSSPCANLGEGWRTPQTEEFNALGRTAAALGKDTFMSYWKPQYAGYYNTQNDTGVGWDTTENYAVYSTATDNIPYKAVMNSSGVFGFPTRRYNQAIYEKWPWRCVRDM